MRSLFSKQVMTMSDWITPRNITQEDLVWRFGETTADDIVHIESQICNHARGFVLDNDIWFDQYAVMMGHRFAWNSHISPHYPEAEKWIDVSDNGLYFSITGSGSFILQHPIGHNITQKHLETLYALGQKMEFADGYEVTLRNEEYDSYENSRDTEKVSFEQIYEYITSRENSNLIENIIGEPDEKHGLPYRERLEQRRSGRQENNDSETDGDSDNDESGSSHTRQTTVAVTETHIEEDDGLYELFFTGQKSSGETVEMKWGEIVTERQAERFSDELIGTHFKGSEVKRLQESKFME